MFVEKCERTIDEEERKINPKAKLQQKAFFLEKQSQIYARVNAMGRPTDL